MHFSENTAVSILEPFFSDFQECIESGFYAYLTHYKAVAHLHGRTTKAIIVNDHIKNFARTYFEDKNNIQIIEPKGLFLVQVNGKVLIRFKKLSSDLHSSNVQTKQQVAFKAQLPLEGIPPNLPRLDAGYIPNQLWTKLDGIFFTYPSGNKIPWSISIGEKYKKPKTLPIPFPSAKPINNTTKRVRVKKAPINIKTKK